MAKISRDMATPVGGTALLHPRETLIVAGNLAALNAEIILHVDGCASFAVDLRGTFSGTFEAAGTVDGVNYTPIPVRPVNQAALVYVASIVGTAAGVWVGKCSPFRAIRLRATAFTSGSATSVMAAHVAPLDDTLSAMITSSLVTATAAISTAVTLTLPAPGAGLRQYFTFIRVVRSNAAATALTAAAGPVLITTTNLPGSPVLAMSNDALPIGGIERAFLEFSLPLSASAQNTAVTVIAAIATGVIWRLTAGYYVAP